MKWAVLVNAAPHSSAGAETAYRFTRAALLGGHQVIRVFFYGDGVYAAQRHACPAADELDLTARWSELAQTAAVDLVLCSAAAERRGVLGAATEAGQWSGVADGFRVAGLGLWLDACLQADRRMVFHG